MNLPFIICFTLMSVCSLRTESFFFFSSSIVSPNTKNGPWHIVGTQELLVTAGFLDCLRSLGFNAEVSCEGSSSLFAGCAIAPYGSQFPARLLVSVERK